MGKMGSREVAKNSGRAWLSERSGFATRMVRSAMDQDGTLLVLDGAPGMGKTFLLRELIGEIAENTTWKASFVRADEIERSEPYSFLERFIAGSVARDWLFEVNAQTNPVELARECVHQLTSRGGGEQVLVIDDAQWIDEASQRVLRYVIPRVVRRHKLMAFGVRTPHEPGSFGEFLVGLCADSPTDLVHNLAPLTAADVGALVRERYATRISQQSIDRILDATGGSFLGVDSVLSAIADQSGEHSHLSWEAEIEVSLHDASPLLHVFQQLALPVQRTCELVSLAGHELTRAELHSASVELDEPLELAAAIAAEVLTETGSDHVVLPRHVLLADAIVETVAPERARAVHRALAHVTSGHRSVRHAIRGTEQWNSEVHALVAAYVEEQAEAGNLTNASEALREALARVTDSATRQQLIVDLALIHLQAKSSYQVLDLLPELESLPHSILHEMLAIITGAHQLGAAVSPQRVQQLLATPPQSLDDLVVLAHFAFMLVILSMRSPDDAELLQVIGFAQQLTAQLPDSAEHVANPRLRWMVDREAQSTLLDCYVVVHAQRSADTETVARLLPAAVTRVEALAEGTLQADALVSIAGVEVSIGDIAAARSHAERAVEMLDRVPLPWAAGTARVMLADCMIMQGELREAEAYMDLVEEFAYATMDVEARPALAALRARVAALTNIEEWESHANTARRQQTFAWEGYEPSLHLIAECEAAQVLGEPAGVLSASEGEWVADLGNTRHGFLTYRAHALIETGQLTQAAELIEQLAAWRGTRWLEIWGSLDWLRARLAESQGETENALWFYAAAVANQDFPLPLALSRQHYAALLARVGQVEASYEQLNKAHEALEQMGARSYLDLNNAMLAAASAGAELQQARVDGAVLETLTEREQQVAAQLARGRSNSQIAESLVVSVATVRTHVSNVLRKLKLSSRGEVAKLFRNLNSVD